MVGSMRNIRLDIREGGFCATLLQAVRKSLILNGEMLERSIRHAWKACVALRPLVRDHSDAHGALRVRITSMRAARNAGTRQARIATTVNVAVVTRITRPSECATPYRYDPSSRPAVSVPTAPNPTPAIASHSPSPTSSATI